MTTHVGLLGTLIERWRNAGAENEFLVSRSDGSTLTIDPQSYYWFADQLEAALATLPQRPEDLQNLQAFGEAEKTAALKSQDRPKYDFYAGWVSALDKLAIQFTFGALPPAPPQARESRKCTCWLGTTSTFGSSEARMKCAVHGDNIAASPPAQAQEPTP
jgi:hypothetical protein